MAGCVHAPPREVDVEVAGTDAYGYRVGDVVRCDWFGQDVEVTITRVTASVLSLREVA